MTTDPRHWFEISQQTSAQNRDAIWSLLEGWSRNSGMFRILMGMQERRFNVRSKIQIDVYNSNDPNYQNENPLRTPGSTAGVSEIITYLLDPATGAPVIDDMNRPGNPGGHLVGVKQR